VNVETNDTSHTILVVDDDIFSSKVIVAYLKMLGSRVLTAHDGKSGIESALRERPDLILLDIVMPEMDGFEVCRRLKAHETTKYIPVIFMTGLTATEHKVKGFQMGAVDCISPVLAWRFGSATRDRASPRMCGPEFSSLCSAPSVTAWDWGCPSSKTSWSSTVEV
jgi:PleD family two-component response regulator